jgi:quinol monooxygenase YgiN
MQAVQIDWHATPFRAEKFQALYEPAVSRVMSYGAKGYLFYRSEVDPQHFVHVSIWEEGADFDRYWFSREMSNVRKSIAGFYTQPVLPVKSLVLTRG